MKIEICEQMTQSWLSHIKGCQVVQTNWSISPLRLDSMKASVQYKASEIFISQVQTALGSHAFPGHFDADSFLSTLAKDMVSDLYEGANFEMPDDLETQEDIDDTFYRKFMSFVGFAQKNKVDTGAWLNDIKILSRGKNKDPFFTFVKQCETDVVGVKVKDNTVEKVYLVDTAFHSAGLNYSGTSNTETRVTKKLIKFVAVSDLVFGINVPVHIIFAAPLCLKTPFNRIKYILDHIIRPCVDRRPSLAGATNNLTIDLYCNDDFTQKIYNPLKANLDELNNDNELFTRALSLAKLCEPSGKWKTGSNGKTPKTGGSIGGAAKKRHVWTESEKYEMAARYLKDGVGLKALEENLRGYSSNGTAARTCLQNLGIETDGSFKGLLKNSNIDDEIYKAWGKFKETLEEIKKRKLL